MSTYVPTGESELISNVDIDASYTHQYYFASVTDQNNFFASKVTKFLKS